MLIQVLECMLRVRESSASKRVSHSKILFKLKGNLSHSFVFFIVFDFFQLGELLFFSGTLDAGFLGGVGEGRTGGHHMSTFAAVKAKSFLGALLSFFRGKFLREFDRVNVHGVRVLGGSRG